MRVSESSLPDFFQGGIFEVCHTLKMSSHKNRLGKVLCNIYSQHFAKTQYIAKTRFISIAKVITQNFYFIIYFNWLDY